MTRVDDVKKVMRYSKSLRRFTTHTMYTLRFSSYK